MNIKLMSLALGLVISVTGTGQNRFFTKTGHIEFFSHTAIEDIQAVNDQVTSFMDISTGDMVFAVLIRSFEFPKPLMQEHFNENYLESEKFPKASFEGKISNMKAIDFTKPGNYPVKVTGKLSIHGVTRDIAADGQLTVKKDTIVGDAVFNIRPEDYNINIPAMVKQKLAEYLKVTVQMNYQLYSPKK